MTKKYNYTMKTGRPTTYKPEYCKAIIDHFSVPHIKEGGDETKPNRFPTLEGFAAKLNTTTECLVNWSQDHKDFYAAYSRAKELQKDNLIDNSLARRFDSNFAKFVGINCCGMVSEKADINLGGQKDNPIEIIDNPESAKDYYKKKQELLEKAAIAGTAVAKD